MPNITTTATDMQPTTQDNPAGSVSQHRQTSESVPTQSWSDTVQNTYSPTEH